MTLPRRKDKLFLSEFRNRDVNIGALGVITKLYKGFIADDEIFGVFGLEDTCDLGGRVVL